MRALLVDALGTIVRLDPPAPRLARLLGLPLEAVEPAVREEMAYYREHAHEGRDEASLADLRGRCADLVSERLGVQVSVEALMGSIVFGAYEDAAPLLDEAGRRGLTRICVSNWDVGLGEVLERVGLAPLLDGLVTSAAAGARKPDPAIFERALELAGCAPEEAVHVGDSSEEDVAGARAAGIRALLLARDGGGGDVRSLAEVMAEAVA